MPRIGASFLCCLRSTTAAALLKAKKAGTETGTGKQTGAMMVISILLL